MKTSLSKIFFGVLAAAVIAYLGYQVYLFAMPGVKTEIVSLYTATADITTSGYITRRELIVEKETDGVYGVTAEQNERISKDAPLATVYESDEQADVSREIKSLETRIKRLREVTEEFTPGTLELAQLEEQIAAAITSAGIGADLGSGSSVLASKDELAVLLSRKALLTGDEGTLEELIAQLEAEKTQLEAQSAGGVTVQRAPESGYFVESTDGYETVLTPETVKSLTVEDLKGLARIDPAQQDRSRILGKILPDFTWYLSALVTESELSGLEVGSSVTLKFPFAEGVAVPATVCAISAEQDGQFVLTLESSYEVRELNLIRNPNVQIIKRTYSGLKVPERAVRVNDEGEQGVFIRTGNVIQWRPVEILFAKDNYYIVSYKEEGSKRLLLYDEVVTDGKNLYDGKVI